MEKTSCTLGMCSDCISIENDSIVIDHMHCVMTGSHYQWRYPTPGDSVEVERKQLLSVKKTGYWELSFSRSVTFKLTNGNYITTAVNLP